ncbi:hypothetical protein V6N13_064263 [Hibiscus sabdariffa]
MVKAQQLVKVLEESRYVKVEAIMMTNIQVVMANDEVEDARPSWFLLIRKHTILFNQPKREPLGLESDCNDICLVKASSSNCYSLS